MFVHRRQRVLSGWNEKNSHLLAKEKEDLKTKWGNQEGSIVIR